MPFEVPWIQQSIVDLEKRRKDAEDWAREQMAGLSSQWADTWRQDLDRLVTDWQSRLPPQSAGAFGPAYVVEETLTGGAGRRAAQAGLEWAGTSVSSAQRAFAEEAIRQGREEGAEWPMGFASPRQQARKVGAAARGFVEPGQQLGEYAAERLVERGVGETPAAIAGTVYEALADPTNIFGAKPASTIRRLPALRGAAEAEKAAGEAAGRALPRAPLAVVPKGSEPITLTAEEEVARLRLDKFPEWARDTIAQAAEKADWARTQRRGVVPTAVSEQMADDLGRTVEQWIGQGKAGKAYNTEETRALRNAITGQVAKVNELDDAVKAAGPANVTDAMIAQQFVEGEKLAALWRVGEGARAEWGRAGLAWQAATRAVDAPMEEVAARIFKKVNGRDNALKALSEFRALRDAGGTPIQVAQFWAKVEKPPPGFEDWFKALRYNSMMSGPRTAEINFIGTGINVLGHAAADVGESLVRLRPREIPAEAAGIWTGMRQGARDFMEVLTSGITTEQAMKGDVPSALSARVSGTAQRVAATALELPGRINMAADAFWHGTAYQMALARDAATSASKAGTRGEGWATQVADYLANPPAASMAKAMKAADEMTFHGKMGALGEALGHVQRVPYVGNVVLPFLRTVYHITARGIEMTPAGLVGTGIDVARGVYKPGKAVPEHLPELSTRLRSNVVGSLAFVGMYDQATRGNISAAGPDSAQQRDLLRAQGWQPYSVKVGNSWVSYSNWGPLAIPLSMAAGAAEAQQYRKPSDAPMATVADGMGRFGRLVTEQAYLKQIGSVYQSITDPERYGARWLEDTMQSLIPFGSAINTLGQATDPYARRPEKGNVEQVMAARFPGLREQVPVVQDVLGRPVENVAQGLKAFQPLRISPAQDDDVLAELERAGVSIPGPIRSIQGIPLTDGEQRYLQRTAGLEIQNRLVRVMNSGAYTRTGPQERARILKQAIRDAREEATEEFLAGLPRIERLTRAREAAGVR